MKVIVVGAGICGASTAFHLAELGAEVNVIDNSALGRATFAGAGIICPWLSKSQDPSYQKLAFAAFRYYPKLMAKLAEAGQTEIDYDLVGGLAVGESRDQLDPVIQRLESYLADGIKEIGKVQMLDPGGPKELFPCLDPRLAGVYLSGAIRLSGEAVRTGMLNAACAAGAKVLSGTAVLQRTGNTATGVKVSGAFVSGDTVVIAAGAWSVNLCRTLGLELKLEPQRGQILHLRVPETDTESWPVIVPVLNDYYLLAFRDSRVVLGATRESGSGFDPRVTAGGVAELLREGLQIAPGLKTATLAEIRVGLRPMTENGLPLLGAVPPLERLIIATGLGQYGLTVGPYAGLLAAKLAIGKSPDIDISPFAPDRVD